MRTRAVKRRNARTPPPPPPPPKPPAAPAAPSALPRWQTWAAEPRVRVAAAVLVLACFALAGGIAARTNTPTPDEFVYVPAGYYHLRTGAFDVETSNPPLLKMAMAAPLLAMDLQLDLDPRWRDDRTGWGAWIFGTRFMELNRARYLDAFFAARMVVVAIGVALGVLVFRRACALLSPLAALAVLVLYGTLPPMIAHAAVGTLDVGVTALLFATFVALERFASAKTWSWAAVSGALFGLAFVVKGVAALFAPLVPLLVALSWGAWDVAGLRRLVVGAGAFIVGGWLAILVSYGFDGFPLPPSLVAGVRFQIAASSAGEFPAFLLGSWSQTGWWYYYLVALALKTPIATLVFVLIGLGVAVWRRLGEPGDLWIVLPPLFLIYVLSFHYGKNYGVRYMLPAFPFLLLVAGRGVDAVLRAGRVGPVVAGVLLAWQGIACALTTPHHLSYFNELAGGTARARRMLLDSNLDWGQDLGRLKAWMVEQGTSSICLGYFGHVDPKVYDIAYTFPPPTPTAGRCAVSANFLAGYPYAVTYAGERIMGVKRGVWSWYDRFQPVARIGDSIYVFDVTADDVARAGPPVAPGGR